MGHEIREGLFAHNLPQHLRALAGFHRRPQFFVRVEKGLLVSALHI